MPRKACRAISDARHIKIRAAGPLIGPRRRCALAGQLAGASSKSRPPEGARRTPEEIKHPGAAPAGRPAGWVDGVAVSPAAPARVVGNRPRPASRPAPHRRAYRPHACGLWRAQVCKREEVFCFSTHNEKSIVFASAGKAKPRRGGKRSAQPEGRRLLTCPLFQGGSPAGPPEAPPLCRSRSEARTAAQPTSEPKAERVRCGERCTHLR